jgi:hypothetical protein
MVGEFLRGLGCARVVPRHVAILGLPVERPSASSAKVSKPTTTSARSSTPCPTAITRGSR